MVEGAEAAEARAAVAMVVGRPWVAAASRATAGAVGRVWDGGGGTATEAGGRPARLGVSDGEAGWRRGGGGYGLPLEAADWVMAPHGGGRFAMTASAAVGVTRQRRRTRRRYRRRGGGGGLGSGRGEGGGHGGRNRSEGGGRWRRRWRERGWERVVWWIRRRSG